LQNLASGLSRSALREDEQPGNDNDEGQSFNQQGIGNKPVSTLRLSNSTKPMPGRISKNIAVDYGVHKSLRGLLWQIVPDASGDSPMCIFAREFLGKRAGVRLMWCPIGVAFQSDGRHGDDRTYGKALPDRHI